MNFYTISLFVESLLYGIYTSLFFVALYVLITRPKTNTNVCILIVTSIMYGIASVHMVLRLQDAEPFPTCLSLHCVFTLRLMEQYLPTVNFILGDAIVAWRAWVIWERSYRVVVGPIILLVATTGVVTAELVLGMRTAPHFITPNPAGYVRAYHRTIVMHSAAIALTLCTNLLVTGLIGYRTWSHYRTASVYKLRVGRDRTQAVLTLLVESGALYCCIWLTYLIMDRTSGNYAKTKSLAFTIFDYAIPQLIGIYPTLIVVLCSLQRSYQDTIVASYTYLPRSSPQNSAPPQSHDRSEVFPAFKPAYTYYIDPGMRTASPLHTPPPAMRIRIPSFVDIRASNASLAPLSVPRRPPPSHRRSRSFSSLVDDVDAPKAHHLTLDSDVERGTHFLDALEQAILNAKAEVEAGLVPKRSRSDPDFRV
ncbi:hypothetical protein BV25DRAFT_1833383 [Artomyces pyxidatus]|uniref:Uncharacterized protein n=1 Tax=Artomyces pyxidatus TaxID=48021 RepID=A0ACB8SH07_9AGAM|nr:hypothetical protein BV25DRAFT_1833383 [Artomyces pyxidatus]